jgi:hypothetical protein
MINELKEKFNDNYRKVILFLFINYILMSFILVCIYFNSIKYALLLCLINGINIVWLEHKWKVNVKLKGTIYRRIVDYPLCFIYIIIFVFLTTE